MKILGIFIFLGLIPGCGGANNNLASTQSVASALPDAGSIYNSILGSMKHNPHYVDQVTASASMNISDYFKAIGASSGAVSSAAVFTAGGSIGALLSAAGLTTSSLSLEEVKTAFAGISNPASLSGAAATELGLTAVTMKVALFLAHPTTNSSLGLLVALDPCWWLIQLGQQDLSGSGQQVQSGDASAAYEVPANQMLGLVALPTIPSQCRTLGAGGSGPVHYGESGESGILTPDRWQQERQNALEAGWANYFKLYGGGGTGAKL